MLKDVKLARKILRGGEQHVEGCTQTFQTRSDLLVGQLACILA